jgi:hypothetical protein
MFEKKGSFFAGWRNRNGQRKRKFFTSGRAALRFEQEQKELAHPKPPARVKLSPRYSAPSLRGALRSVCAAAWCHQSNPDPHRRTCAAQTEQAG